MILLFYIMNVCCMSIHTQQSSSEDNRTYTFQNEQKEEFVLQTIATRKECFPWYDEDFIKKLFDEDFSTQDELDTFLNERLIDYSMEYYFQNPTESHQSKETYMVDVRDQATKVIDDLVWNFNEFKDKIIENANSIASQLVEEKYQQSIGEDTMIMLQSIKDTLPKCCMTEESKKALHKYMSTSIDVITMLNKPHLFTSWLSFASIQEQVNMSHVIIGEYQKFQIIAWNKMKDVRDKVNPKEIDSELFDSTQKLYSMVLDWKKRAYWILHVKIMNRIHSQYIVSCLHQNSLSKKNVS